MQFAHLEVFLSVIEEGTFNGAAKRLWVAPSRVTERIQQLEKELRVSLFDRSKGTLITTQAGLSLVPRAQAIKREMELIKKMFPEDDTPRVRVGIRTLPVDIRDRIQSRIRSTRELTEVSFFPLDTSTQIQLMMSGQLECGFLWSPPPPPLDYFPVLSESFAIAVPANSHFSSIELIAPEDLAGLKLASILDPLTVPAEIGAYLKFLPTSDIVNPAVADATLLLVAGGNHCAFVAATATDGNSLSRDQRRNILIKPLLPPVPEVHTYFSWRPEVATAPHFAPILEQMRNLFPQPISR